MNKYHSKFRFLTMLVLVLFFSFLLSGCGIEEESDDPYDKIVDGALNLPPTVNSELTYTGKAQVTRGEKHCPLTGDVVITMKPGDTFTMKVTAADVDANCVASGDLQSTTLSGYLDVPNAYLVFTKCPYNETKPDTQPRSWTQRVASGKVSCFDKDAGGKAITFYTVDFEANRVVE